MRPEPVDPGEARPFPRLFPHVRGRLFRVCAVLECANGEIVGDERERFAEDFEPAPSVLGLEDGGRRGDELFEDVQARHEARVEVAEAGLIPERLISWHG